eukprot:TRINITY_DN36477_c0_g1_i1.p1 TRINITY_DN36477_c0_g1~~TRINITY_DN36477_c0_g1_i1.p1  ORF type:complete len:345 (+),score=117.02 TRINITY_DN36477_c0_g1_i1:178-1212(+)
MASLGRTLQHLENADEAADAAKANLQKQNQRLEKMGHNMDRIHQNLDQSEQQIGELERNANLASSMMDDCVKAVGGKVISGAKAVHLDKVGEAMAKGVQAVGIDSAAEALTGEKLTECVSKAIHSVAENPEAPVDPGGFALVEGVLHMRGKLYGYKWEPKWVALHPAAILWYDDKEATAREGQIRLGPGARGFTYKAKDAPGDALKHRGEKPFGFVFDSMPSSTHYDRPLFYFDAESEDNLQCWLKAIRRAGRRQRIVVTGGAASFVQREAEANPSAKALPAEEKEALDMINSKLDGLQEKADDLSKEAKKQADIVEGLEDKVEEETARIKQQDARLKQHLRDT